MNKKVKIAVLSLTSIVVIVLIGFVILAKLAGPSLPGESLYSFKTNVAEKIIRSTKLSTAARVEYDNTLLEQRLQELVTIASDKASTSPELIASVASLANIHASDAVAALDANPSLRSEDRITYLANLNTIARAGEMLSDSTPELDTISDSLGDTEVILNDALKTAITGFISNNATDTVQSYIATNITTVSEHIGDVAPGSRAQQLAVRRISETKEAITDNKFSEALTAIIRAQQAISTDGYLFDSERGPVDGVAIEAGPIPEGN